MVVACGCKLNFLSNLFLFPVAHGDRCLGLTGCLFLSYYAFLLRVV